MCRISPLRSYSSVRGTTGGGVYGEIGGGSRNHCSGVVNVMVPVYITLYAYVQKEIIFTTYIIYCIIVIKVVVCWS